MLQEVQCRLVAAWELVQSKLVFDALEERHSYSSAAEEGQETPYVLEEQSSCFALALWAQARRRQTGLDCWPAFDARQWARGVADVGYPWLTKIMLPRSLFDVIYIIYLAPLLRVGRSFGGKSASTETKEINGYLLRERIFLMLKNGLSVPVCAYIFYYM